MKKENLTKELELIKSQVSKAEVIAGSLEIKVPDDMVNATDILSKIKIVGKMIAKKKESITKPLNEALRNARSLFTPLENQWSDAEKTVKMKMVMFNNAERIKAEKKMEKIEKKVESGKMKPELAIEKIDTIVPKNKVEAKSGSIQFRTIREVVIEDETKLTRKYLAPNIVKIKADALRGVKIKGVKVIEKQIVAGTTN